jgi:HdeA/HdeB family
MWRNEGCEMKILACLTIALIAAAGAKAEVVTLEFYKDNCEKFLKSEPSDQEMYLMWATGRISRDLRKDAKTASIKVDDATTSQWLRDYCAGHPSATLVQATDAAKVQLAGGSHS